MEIVQLGIVVVDIVLIDEGIEGGDLGGAGNKDSAVGIVFIVHRKAEYRHTTNRIGGASAYLVELVNRTRAVTNDIEQIMIGRIGGLVALFEQNILRQTRIVVDIMQGIVGAVAGGNADIFKSGAAVVVEIFGAVRLSLSYFVNTRGHNTRGQTPCVANRPLCSSICFTILFKLSFGCNGKSCSLADGTHLKVFSFGSRHLKGGFPIRGEII